MDEAAKRTRKSRRVFATSVLAFFWVRSLWQWCYLVITVTILKCLYTRNVAENETETRTFIKSKQLNIISDFHFQKKVQMREKSK